MAGVSWKEGDLCLSPDWILFHSNRDDKGVCLWKWGWQSPHLMSWSVGSSKTRKSESFIKAFERLTSSGQQHSQCTVRGQPLLFGKISITLPEDSSNL